MVRLAAQSTAVPGSRGKAGSAAKVFNAFLTIRPCGYGDLPTTYAPSILYGLGVAFFCAMSALLGLSLHGVQHPSIAQLAVVVTLLSAAAILLSALVSSALASLLFGRSLSPQGYALWVGAWTYVPLVVLLPALSPHVAGICNLVLCILNAYLLSAFANSKRPFEDQREHLFYNVYCFIALLLGYLSLGCLL